MDHTVTIGIAGDYKLTWSDAGRASYFGGASGNQTYDVLFNGVVLDSFSTTTGSAWATHSLVFSSGVGSFTLELLGKTSSGDNSALLDNFSLTPSEETGGSEVPEPRAVSAMLMGLFLFMGWVRRRNRAAA
jgi:hypothetical protein